MVTGTTSQGRTKLTYHYQHPDLIVMTLKRKNYVISRVSYIIIDEYDLIITDYKSITHH